MLAPGSYLPGTFRPQGFSPSRRLAPRQPARPCFVPERSWSSTPFRAFPSTGAVAPLGALLPSCHPPPPPSRPTFAPRDCSPVGTVARTGGVECDFKALLPGASPLRWLLAVRPTARPMLSWASGPFRVLPPDRVLVCFHRAPPSSFRSVRLGLAPCTDFTGSSESLPGRDWPCSAQHGRPSWGFPPRR